MKPTRKQIDEEIKALKELAPRIRQVSFWGDSNRKAIEAEIQVLQKDPDYGEIDREFTDHHAHSSALDAKAWLDGNEDYEETLSAGWIPLLEDE